MQRGRLHARWCPTSPALVPSTWAEPCVPLAGPSGPPMGVYMVPPIGAGVWVEFEQRRSAIIRSGSAAAGARRRRADCWRSPACRCPEHHACRRVGQNMLMISDMPPTPATGGIMLKSLTGATLVVNDAGIFIQNGKGAVDHADGAGGRHQSRRAHDRLKRRKNSEHGNARTHPSHRRHRHSARMAVRPCRPRRCRA